MRDDGSVMSVTPRRSRTRGATQAPDGLCAAAFDRALAAAREIGDDQVGDHLGCVSEGDRIVTHYFASLLPGYVGWRWAVTVTRASRQRVVTVDEVVLLPGPDALRPPEWVPWSERLRPGDLGVGDLLPAPREDDRLVPAYVDSGDPAVEEAAWELGLGRQRVMSKPGREEVAERWYTSGNGPDTPMARHAPGHCGTCGFYLPLAGSLRAMFGACGNEYAPADGCVVSADYGCGAHSEALVEAPSPEPPPTPVYDDAEVELVSAQPEHGQQPQDAAPTGSQPGSADGSEAGQASAGHAEAEPAGAAQAVVEPAEAALAEAVQPAADE